MSDQVNSRNYTFQDTNKQRKTPA